MEPKRLDVCVRFSFPSNRRIYFHCYFFGVSFYLLSFSSQVSPVEGKGGGVGLGELLKEEELRTRYKYKRLMSNRLCLFVRNGLLLRVIKPPDLVLLPAPTHSEIVLGSQGCYFVIIITCRNCNTFRSTLRGSVRATAHIIKLNGPLLLIVARFIARNTTCITKAKTVRCTKRNGLMFLLAFISLF